MASLSPRAPPKLNVECASENMLPRRDGRFFSQRPTPPFATHQHCARGCGGGPRTWHVLPLDGRLFRRHRLPEQTATWMPKAEVRNLESILCPLCKALGCDEETFFTQARPSLRRSKECLKGTHPTSVCGEDCFRKDSRAGQPGGLAAGWSGSWAAR